MQLQLQRFNFFVFRTVLHLLSLGRSSFSLGHRIQSTVRVLHKV